MNSPMKLQMLVVPVETLEKALAFYRDTCGWTLKFRDGERYAALDAGGLTLALTTGSESICAIAAPALRVADIESALQRLLQAGAGIVRPIETGPHERRAAVRAPDGTVLLLSERLEEKTS
jgi:predicted enzyme related to lactoylglutathione lyase